MRQVIVGWNADTNQLGTVYHRPDCYHVARLFGHKSMSLEAAEDAGKPACLKCHKLSNRNLLCPQHEEKPTVLVTKAEGGSAMLFLHCPECDLEIHQKEAL